MTKYKKLTRSSFVIVALCLALVGILAFGGTYAYFSASDTATGTVAMGTLEVSLKDDASDMDSISFSSTIAQPNQQILSKEVTIDAGDTDINFYTRIKFDASLTAKEGASHADSCGDSKLDSLLTTTLTGWYKHSDGYYYHVVDAETSVTVDNASLTFTPTITLNKDIGKNGCTYYMGGTVTATITVEVLQADYLKDSTTLGTGSNYKVADVATAWANA